MIYKIFICIQKCIKIKNSIYFNETFSHNDGAFPQKDYFILTWPIIGT